MLSTSTPHLVDHLESTLEAAVLVGYLPLHHLSYTFKGGFQVGGIRPSLLPFQRFTRLRHQQSTKPSSFVTILFTSRDLGNLIANLKFTYAFPICGGKVTDITDKASRLHALLYPRLRLPGPGVFHPTRALSNSCPALHLDLTRELCALEPYFSLPLPNDLIFGLVVTIKGSGYPSKTCQSSTALGNFI